MILTDPRTCLELSLFLVQECNVGSENTNKNVYAASPAMRTPYSWYVSIPISSFY